jgi:hypothetical protein
MLDDGSCGVELGAWVMWFIGSEDGAYSGE